eukprot:GCRY01002946.1.p1 GENE.GCRY01002946.1~~GCRY01002946.1.p1  ORF type:complete len:144 (+),score=18.79 GCRY01002946.1:151-582(+)
MDNPAVLKSGFLEKKGFVRKNWKKRWFVLDSEKLTYYKSQNHKTMIKSIFLKDATVKLSASAGTERPFCFEVVTKERIYMFSASTRQLFHEWLVAVSERTELSQENVLINRLEEIICRLSYEEAIRQEVNNPVTEEDIAVFEK